jgi:hypothetical protein
LTSAFILSSKYSLMVARDDPETSAVAQRDRRRLIRVLDTCATYTNRKLRDVRTDSEKVTDIASYSE